MGTRYALVVSDSADHPLTYIVTPVHSVILVAAKARHRAKLTWSSTQTRLISLLYLNGAPKKTTLATRSKRLIRLSGGG